MRYALIAFFLLSLISYASADNESIELIPERSISAEASSWNFSFPVELDISADYLYLVDQKSCTILVFDHNLNFLYAFGDYGSQPGNFSRPLSVCYDGIDQLLVSDFNNSRIQILTMQGDFIKEIPFSAPWKFSSFDDNIYLSNFPGSGDAAVFSLVDGEFFPEINLARYFKKNKFGSVLDKYYSWCVAEWGYVLSFSGKNKAVVFNNSGKAKHETEKLPLLYENTLYGKPQVYEEGFLLLASSNNQNAADSTQTEILYHSLIGQYSRKGKLQKVYELPDNIWLTDSWALYQKRFFLYDSKNLVIMKFELD